MRYRSISIFCVILAVSISGCCCKVPAAKTGDAKVLARVGAYELTVGDFNSEVNLILSNKTLPGDPQEAKKELLDDMVTKEILILEAQRQGLDKEKVFMKEIERYWGQALIKLLIRKKLEELLPSVEVKDDEVRKEYGRITSGKMSPEPYEKLSGEIRESLRHEKLQQGLADWISELKKKSRVEIDGEALKQLTIGK